MVMIRDGGSEEGGEGAHIYCRGMGGGCNVKTDRDGSESDANGGRVCVCLQSEMKYETQKQHTQKKQEENGSRVLSSNQISSSSSAGRPPLPSLPPPPPGSLSLSIPPSLAFSLHPLSERHAEAVGSLRRVWGSARAVRGCYLGLLQQTGSSSPKGRGESRESQSHAQYSTARQEPDLHSS